MKKKILLSVGISIVAIILIVAITFISIIFTVDMTDNIDYLDNKYKSRHDAPIEFDVASYNVKSGYNTKENLVAIREQLKSNGVDIVGLQEVDTDNMLRSKKLKCVSTLASDIYSNHTYAPTNSLFLGKNYGIMTMAQNEILESTILHLPMPNRFFMIIGEPRVCVRTVVNIDGVDIAFYNTHLSFENNIKIDGKEMRQRQIEFIFDNMAKDPCEYKVLVGDFNILNFEELDVFTKSDKYNLVNNKTTNYKSYRGDDVTFKCLDNIIYTSNMQLVSSKMIDNELSDHNMLHAKFRIA